MGVYFRNHLEEINSPLIREIRGQGLMVGVELKIRAAQLVESLMSRGVLSLVSGTTVLRLLPPLVIEQEALDNVTKAIAQSLAEIGVQ
jgi:acetylornithine/LysW-gamma-L-lysine aminotransferase